MVQAKFFRNEELESFNEFVMSHPPKTEGIKFFPTGIILLYETATKELDLTSVLEGLKIELNTHLKNCVDYEKQANIARELRDQETNIKSDKWRTLDDKVNVDNAMLKMEQASVKVVRKMIADMEEKIKNNESEIVPKDNIGE